MCHKNLFYILYEGVFRKGGISLNNFDLMIEKYRKEMFETVKRSAFDFADEEANRENFYDDAVKVNVSVNGSNNDESDLRISTSESDGADRNSNFRKENETIDDIDSDNSDNEKFGRLKVQVAAANGVYPITAALVNVYKTGEDNPYFSGYTDVSGIIDGIILPVPQNVPSDIPTTEKPYSQYDITVVHPRFIPKTFRFVPVFPDTESVQTVLLVPAEAGQDMDAVITEAEPNGLLLKKEGEADA